MAEFISKNVALRKLDIEPEPLLQRDYELVKGALKKWRDVLICKLLRATGLRVSEVLALRPENFREEGIYFVLYVRRGKKPSKNKFERVYLPPQLGVELRDYIKGNRVLAGERIFPITDRQVRNIFYRAGLEAIGRRVHPHEFRGLYIKTLLDGGLPPAAAAKMVGHASSKTTERWYYELTREQRWEIQRRIPV